ncbi:MAG: PilZ domain-containing protein [Desulfobacterales bacterium]|nr:PilZ domain-containing protein [Desulfobacterales bacterium]
MISEPPSMQKTNISAITARLFRLILKMPPEERRELLEDLESRQDAKKRQYPRKDYFMDVQYVINERLYDGYIKNISPAGIFIETAHEDTKTIQSGDPVILTFEHPDSKNPLKITGDVVRVEEGGIGVNFHQLLTTFLNG